MGQHQHQAKRRNHQNQIGFNIVTAMQKTVPGPEMLGDWV
jgi:hypothetical protein